jgi:hypothetical protein
MADILAQIINLTVLSQSLKEDVVSINSIHKILIKENKATDIVVPPSSGNPKFNSHSRLFSLMVSNLFSLFPNPPSHFPS